MLGFRYRRSCFAPLALALTLAASPARAQPGTLQHDKNGKPIAPSGLDPGIGPGRYCTKGEKDAAVKRAETVLKLAEVNASQARQYFQEMKQRIAAEQQAGKVAAAQQDGRELAAFEKVQFKSIADETPKRAQDALDQARKAPVIDCSKPQILEGSRPPLQPVSALALPDKFCRQEDIDSLRVRAEQAFAAADANIDLLTRYIHDLTRIYDLYNTQPDHDSKEIADRVEDEIGSATLQLREQNLLSYQLAVLRLRLRGAKPVPCGENTGPPIEPPALPIRDLFANPVRRFCTEAERARYLEETFNKLIAEAKRRVATERAKANALELAYTGTPPAPEEARRKAFDATEAQRKIAEAADETLVQLGAARKKIILAPLEPCPEETTPPVPKPPAEGPPPKPGGPPSDKPPPPNKKGKAPGHGGSGGG